MKQFLFAACLALLSLATAQAEEAKATFAGGCFWCMEPPFDKLDGVISTTSGYIGGDVQNPTYKQVTFEDTGHREAVQVVYDPTKISYDELLYVFWRNIDPLNKRGQFCDNGFSYTTAIYSHDEAQTKAAEASLAEVKARFDKKIATVIVPATTFWPAEDYHQDYYLKNPLQYKYYRTGCGRDARLKRVWGDEAPYKN